VQVLPSLRRFRWIAEHHPTQLGPQLAGMESIGLPEVWLERLCLGFPAIDEVEEDREATLDLDRSPIPPVELIGELRLANAEPAPHPPQLVALVHSVFLPCQVPSLLLGESCGRRRHSRMAG
jgi:hypothetical protein